MSKIFDYSCPNIVCPAFTRSFTVECWDKDEEDFGEGTEGFPCYESDTKCRECDGPTYDSYEVNNTYNRIFNS